MTFSLQGGRRWIRILFRIWLLQGCFGRQSWAGNLSTTNLFNSAQVGLWSLQPLKDVVIPPLAGNSPVRGAVNPVDSFILAHLKARGLRSSSPTDKGTLLRRIYLDLIGLPPSPREVLAFEVDRAPDAFIRVVDRLLASPQYGERWARHWLDLARYAESEGFKADETRPNAWRYRDYVIRSLNADKPYDRFVREQLAGDELWPEDADARVATGFNRHYPDESNARNLMQRRQDILNDMTDTAAGVFCGLTLACARCHDHKWDPITQADYYRFQAFFANSAADDRIPLMLPEAGNRHASRLTEWEARTRELREEMNQLEQPHRLAILEDYIVKYPELIQAALKKSAATRTPFEQQMVAKARLYLDPSSHQYLAPPSACAAQMPTAKKSRWQDLKRQLETFASLHPGPVPLGSGIVEVATTAPSTFVLRRGNWESPMEEVQPGIFSVLNSPSTGVIPAVNRSSVAKGSGRRSALAEWITHPKNPLTARVLVNRVWQHHFGQGLVRTPSDLGLKGEAPTHPELLDWLARDFMDHGWSLKHLHRVIVHSACYQTTSVMTADLAGEVEARDPENHLLSHFPRTRLEGEIIRDAALAISGRLNLESGGQSVFPELPPGLETRGGWRVSADPSARDRRSVYVFVRRNTRYPLFESLDMPDTHETCARRMVTTSPVQALTLLNSRLSHDWAESFADRVLGQAGADESIQVRVAWQFAYGRLPDANEIKLARSFFVSQSSLIAVRKQAGEAVRVPSPLPLGESSNHAAALVDLCHALMNSNEFVYRN